VTDPPDLRVSDQQREQAAREIREHFAAGRLTEDELSDRLSAAYRARTEQELKTLTTDLPALPVTRAQEKAELAERRRHLQRRMLQEAGGGLVPFAVCTAIWLADGASGQFWPVWILLIALLPLLRTGWMLYGPAPELDRVERDLQDRERRRAQQKRHREHHRRRTDR
jgi:Domain of unknown function (DUF1707)